MELRETLMKKKILIVIFLIFTVISQGCIEENKKNGEKLVTAPLNTLGFKSDDLPSNYTIPSEFFNNTEISDNLTNGVTVIALERYNAFYGFNATLPPSLTILMTKYDSTDSASAVFSDYNIYFFNNDSSGEMYERVIADQLGDESAIGVLTSGEYSGAHQIIFRRLNIVTRFYTTINITQNESIDYAKVLIDYIESSLS
jgi:hypothetical protein